MRHALVAEDDEGSLLLVRTILESAGWRVTSAADGVEALAAARRDPPDIVIADGLMPRMDGFSLCRAWTKDPGLASIPFILYSGTYTSSEDEAFAHSLGAARYLLKSLAPEAFLRELESVFAEQSAKPPAGEAPPLDDNAYLALHDATISRKLASKIDQVEEMSRIAAQKERNYRRLFEANPHPMFIYEIATLRILAVNDAAVAQYGFRRDELLGMTIAEMRPSEDVPRLLENVALVTDKGIDRAGLWRHRRKDGSLIDVDITSHVIDFEGKRAEIVLALDVTDRSKAEQQVLRHAAQIETAFMGTVELVMKLTEMRDPYTVGHERRVADIAVALGRELGLDERGIEGLRVAGYLHDVGKICVPTEILAKPTRLTAIEYELIKKHPQVGFDVLKDLESPWPVARIALQHHERLDGSGYPSGLKNGEIMYEARIMAVADTLEAMAAHRPYRPGLGLQAALAEIERGRSTSYDPDVADCCLRMYREEGRALPA